MERGSWGTQNECMEAVACLSHVGKMPALASCDTSQTSTPGPDDRTQKTTPRQEETTNSD